MANRKRKSVNEELREKSLPYRVNGNGVHRKFSFIDLFCGIGGFRFAFEAAGCECVFTSDWNKYAEQTYAAKFNETPHGDIHSVTVAEIPEHHILCAGFPCQRSASLGCPKN
jgi:DNA (cytosine-5)-methyltransferase 1